MGNWRTWRCRGFYQEQLDILEAGLKSFYNNSEAKINKEQYFLLCEQLGNDPIPEEIPVDFSDFPHQIQEVIQIFSILPGVFEGMTGTYMWVDYALLPYLFDEIFVVRDKQIAMKFLLIIGNIMMEKYTQKQKQRERKAKTAKKTR